MPTYKVTAPDGRTVSLTGDSPPTEAELEDVFSALSAQPKAPAPATGSAAGRFAEGAWENLNPVNMVKGVAGAVMHPIDTVKAAGSAMGSEWEKAGTAASQGRYSEAAGHGLAGSLPLVGPAAAAIGERIGEGDVAGGVGAGTGLIASMFAPRAVSGTVKVANKIRAPFAGTMDAGVAAAAAREGVAMPASALSTSKVVPALEAISAKGFGGGETVARAVGATSELTARAEHLAGRASKLATESQRGVAIAEGFDAFRGAWMRTKNALYKSAAIPEGLVADTSKSAALVDEILKQKQGAANVSGGAQDLSFFESLRDGLSSGKVAAKDLRAAVQELNAKIGGAHADAWSAANKQLLKKVAATMGDDFEAALKSGAPDVAAKLEAANLHYRTGLEKVNSAFGKAINRLAKAGEYDKIGRAVANSKMSVENIPKIMEVAGPDGASAIQASVLSEIVARSKNASGQLTPQGLARAVAGWEKASPGALDVILTPEQAGKLRDLATLSTAMEKGANVTQGSQTAYLGRLMGHGSLAMVSPVMALKTFLGDLAFNKFIGSQHGQKWLTVGYKPWSVGAIDTAPARLGALGASAIGDPSTQPEQRQR
jgi:hypothetical protein